MSSFGGNLHQELLRCDLGVITLTKHTSSVTSKFNYETPNTKQWCPTSVVSYNGGHFHWFCGASSISGSHGRHCNIARAKASSRSPWISSSSTCPQLIFSSIFSTFRSDLTMLSRSSISICKYTILEIYSPRSQLLGCLWLAGTLSGWLSDLSR